MYHGSHPKLSELVSRVMIRGRTLTDDQVSALILASFVLGSATWPGAVKMLDGLSEDRKHNVVDTLKLGLYKRVSIDTTEWICDNMALVEEQHF